MFIYKDGGILQLLINVINGSLYKSYVGKFYSFNTGKFCSQNSVVKIISSQDSRLQTVSVKRTKRKTNVYLIICESFSSKCVVFYHWFVLKRNDSINSWILWEINKI